MKKIVLLLLLAISMVFFTSCDSSDDTAEGIVENAVFSDLDGNQVKVSDFKGKVVMIDFWESWCGPCLQVFPSLDELRSEYPDNFEVLAVTVGLNEGPEDARAFAAEHGYDFNWLYDEHGVFTRLGGQGIPFKAFVDPDGNFIKIEMGSHGREGDYTRTKELIEEYL
jgi:thiol-disulfide isomerase/thioredoxin